MIREGSLSHHILSEVSRHHEGVGAKALQKKIGGNKASLVVQLCRHVTKGYLETVVVEWYVPNHMERLAYKLTNKGHDMLGQVGVLPGEEEPEAPDPVHVQSFTPNSIWDLARTL